ncbi:MAG: divergent polysaccharide deacetylase family protein [Rickettsiales bacterium]
MENNKGTRRSPFFWQNLLWKLGLFFLLIVLVSQMVIIWLMGEQETADAFASGRRLIVTLEDSSISGKIVAFESPAPEQSEPAKKEEESVEAQNPPAVQTQTVEPNTPEKSEDIKKEEPVEEATAVTLISEEPEETLPTMKPSENPTAILSDKLIEKTEFGSLPKISSDGIKPWKYYAKQMPDKGNKPVISIIVTGLGSNKKISESALRLPEAINLSFSPYAPDLKSWMTSARISGHELLLDLPMESSNYPVADPGPLGLLVSKEQTENENKIRKLMAHDFGYVGFVTPHDDVFLDNNELMKSLLHILSGRGLMMVVGRQPAKNDTKELIEKGTTASVIIDTLVDEELTVTAIQAHLTLLEQTAKQRGYAVGVTKAYPITIKQLNIWAEKLEENGFTLVPVSQIVAKRF